MSTDDRADVRARGGGKPTPVVGREFAEPAEAGKDRGEAAEVASAIPSSSLSDSSSEGWSGTPGVDEEPSAIALPGMEPTTHRRKRNKAWRGAATVSGILRVHEYANVN